MIILISRKHPTIGLVLDSTKKIILLFEKNKNEEPELKHGKTLRPFLIE